MAVKTWICSILVFSIFLTVFLQLLPGKQYEKYVRFFSGLIWILVVMQPVLQLFHLENPVNGIVQILSQYQEETRTEAGLDEAQLQQYQAQAWQKQVMEAVTTVVEEKTAAAGFQLERCEPTWDSEQSKLTALYLEVAERKNGQTYGEGADNGGGATNSEDSQADRGGVDKKDNQTDSNGIETQTAVERIRIQIQSQREQGKKQTANTEEETQTDVAASMQGEEQPDKSDTQKKNRDKKTDALRQELEQTFQLPEGQVQIIRISGE